MAGKFLCYVSVSILPNLHANSVQILDFVTELANATSLQLVAPFSNNALAQDFSDMGINVQPVPQKRLGKYIHIALVLIRSRRRIAAILTRSLNVGMGASILLRRPVLIELHHPPSPLQLIMAKYLTPSNFRIATISPVLSADLQKSGLAKTQFIPLSTAGWPKPHANESEIEFDCGYIGSDAPGKGIDNVISAANACPSRSFLIVGIDEGRVRELPPNVTIKPKVAHRDVVTWIDKCKVLLAPYDTVVYGADMRIEITHSISPLKVFEYLSRGKPVIVSSLEAIVGQLGPGAPVQYTPPGNIAALSSAIEELLSDDGKRHALGRAALQEWKTRFQTSARVRQMFSLMRLREPAELQGPITGEDESQP